MTATSDASAGPGRLPSSSPSSSGNKTFYPLWPESHDQAEYFQVPPDHFLAQQRGPNKASQPSTSTSDHHRLVRRSSASSSSSAVISDASMPVAGLSFASDPDALSPLLLPTPQPLSELATAVPSRIPAIPTPLAPAFNPLDRLADAVPRPAGFSTVSEQIPDTSTLAAADFDVDVRSGFLPPEAPIQRLTDLHEQHWEHALDQAKQIPLMQGGGGVNITQHQRILARRWRRSIRQMPVLPLSDQLANDIRYARRGHVVLSFLAHFYIHSQPRKSEDAALVVAPQQPSWLNLFSRNKSPEELQDDQDLADELAGKHMRRLPAAISVPWVQLSQKLDLPPILTYATTVLWNWNYLDPSRGLQPDNLRIVETFTGTPSEHHFFFTSLLIEARGVEALELMRVSLDEAFVADRVARRRIAGYLNRLAEVIKDLTKLLHDVRKGCDPKIFYWGIRPWFVGSDTVDKGEQVGWHFEQVDPEGVKRVFSGPSAGQSSMIHAIDVFLDVDHTRRKERLNRPAATANGGGGDARGADGTFMERMSLYMPGHHRAFLSHLRNISFDDGEDDEEDQEGQDHGVATMSNSVATLSASRISTPATTTIDAESDSEDEAPRELPHPIRSLALAAKTEEHDEGLPAAYDNALQQLKSLRDEHMKIAYLYIVAQARGSPPDAYAPLPKGFTGEPAVDRRLAAKAKAAHADAEAEAEAEADAALDTNSEDNGGGAKGTGGTDLVTFLRDCRVNTIDALIMAKDAVVASSAILKPASDADAENESSGQSTSPTSSQSNILRKSMTDQRNPLTSISSSPTLPPIWDSKLQIWAVDISSQSDTAEDQFRSLVNTLLPGQANTGDREKVMRYYRQADRVRSFTARLLPRLLISAQFGIPWNTIQFKSTLEGRPYYAGSEGLGLDFNISHDSDWVVLAFHTSPGVRVGVDVMSLTLPRYESSIRSFVETMDMALTPAETRWVLASLPSNQTEALRRLFTLWTYKEAYTKNLGKGLGFDFSLIEFTFPSPTSTDEMPKMVAIDQEVRQYGFVDVLLPAVGGGAESQVVVCHGPHPDLAPEDRFGEQLSAQKAEQEGLLHSFTLEQLLELANSCVRSL